MWDNKKDCCNAISRVKGFTISARQIPFENRTKLSSIKNQANIKEAIDQDLSLVDDAIIQKYVEQSKGLRYASKQCTSGD
jgi:hypothetical protein